MTYIDIAFVLLISFIFLGSCSYGFSAAVDIYRPFGFTCNGSESTLSSCCQRGTACQADNPNFALAIECGGASPGKKTVSRV